MSAEISERIRDARAHGDALRIVGGGTWLDAGRPCLATSSLDLSAHSGVTRYEPGDFVLTARAGTTLEEIEHAAAPQGQWLTLDPVGDARSTIGATIATGSYGALSSAFGTPRDHILGCEFVSGTGDIIRAGGQVVKNVAGFDLVRLVTGAWGTLGAITEVTLRMRAKPEVDRSVAIAVAPDGVAKAWRWLRDSEFTPLAAELLTASLAKELALGNQPCVLMRFGGNEALVRSALLAAGSLGPLQDQPTSIWTQLRRIQANMPVVVRLSAQPSLMQDTWRAGLASVESFGGFASATLNRGVVRCSLLGFGAIRSDSQDTHMVYERLSPEHWTAVLSRRDTRHLDARVRAAFDPDRILNPGITDA